MEFVLRIFSVGSFAKGNELFIKLMVHDAEDEVVEQADYEQQTGEEERSRNGIQTIDTEVLTNQRREEHRSEDTDTGDRHLKTHSECHLFAFEPLSEHFGNRGTSHLTTATEDHKAEHSYLS